MAKSELPKGWDWKRLGEVCQINPRKSGLESYDDKTEVTFVPMSVVDEEKGVITTPEIRHLGEVKKGYTFFRENDVLFAKITPCMQNGKAAIARNLVNGLGFGSTEFHVLRPQNNVLSEWIYYIIRQKWFRDLAAANFTGSVGQQRVPAEFLEKQEIPVPSLEEQRRIVARIEELLTRIQQAKSLRQKSLNETSIVLHAAVNEVFKFGKKDGWPAKNISDILTEKPQYGTSQKASENNLGTPLIRMGNIIDGRLSFDDLKFIQLPESEERKYLLRHGDILFNRTNSAELVGKTAVFSEEKKAVFASYLIRLKVDSDKATPHFVAAYINSLFGRAYIQSQLTRAIGQVNVNARKLLEMPILIPDIYEQRRIIAYLDSLQEKVNKLKRLQSETEKEIEQITQSILSKAFQGTL